MGHFDVIDKISDLPILNYKGVEDFADKMSFIASCIFLIACSLIVTLREYVMDPITCYMSHTPGGVNILKFIENYCWVQGTMTFADHKIPDNDAQWREFEKSRIVYYQWVPFMLLFQAALFHLPKILWTVFCFNMAGTNLQELVRSADTSTAETMGAWLENLLVQHREYRKGFFHNVKFKIYSFLRCFIVSKRFGTWLGSGYLLMKLLYLLNSVGQIYLMQVFLQLNLHEEYTSNFGMEIARNIISGRNWEATNVFPRVTYCVARVKQLSAVNTVTAQCVLTANLFIEKIYIFLWFWIVLVALFTCVSMISWIFRLFVPPRYHSEIRKHLKLQGHLVTKSEHIRSFCKNFLRLDGIFLIYMLNVNNGDLTTGPIVSELYKSYVKNYMDKDLFKNETFSYNNSNDTYKMLPKDSESSANNG